MTLTATLRLTGSVCWAIQTVPIPPSPTSSTSLYRPATTAPTASVPPGKAPVPGEPSVGSFLPGAVPGLAGASPGLLDMGLLPGHPYGNPGGGRPPSENAGRPAVV